MQPPPGQNSVAPEPPSLDNAESPLILIHRSYGDTAHYGRWLLRSSLCLPLCFLRLASSSHDQIYVSHLNCPSSA
jgi:hypothetical protein